MKDCDKPDTEERVQGRGSQLFESLPYLKKQQPGDLAESQPLEDAGGNPEPQSHRPCQGTKPWLPCDLGKTPQTCQAPPHSHLKERRRHIVVNGKAITRCITNGYYAAALCFT